MSAWYDYIIFTRYIRRNKFKDNIAEKTQKQLPNPYNPLDIYLEARVSQTPISDSGFNSDFKRSNDNQDNVHAWHKNDGIGIAAFEATGLYGFDVINKFAIIDDHIYGAMSNLAGMQIDNLSDLSAKLQSYDYSVWGGLTEKGIDKISGHLGEVYAAEHLSNAGLDVQWPEASNQAGWDLLVNGHEMNVKTVSDFSSLSKHFSEYPDIPVILPADTANITIDSHVIHFDPTHSIDQIHDAFASSKDHLVFIDDALSHADVLHQTASATEAALGHTDVVSAHFPFITCAFSGFRELNLLLDNRTDIMTSAKHVALDVGGVGGGAFAGAKAGGLLGSLLGPFAAAAGALIGGVGGAISGRILSNGVKRIPLDAAKSNYISAVVKLRSRSDSAEATAQQKYDNALASERHKLKLYAAVLRKELRVKVSSLREWRRSYDIIGSAQSRELHETACKEIGVRLNVILEILQLSPWWHRWIWPDADIFACQDAIRQLKKRRSELTKLNQCTSAKDCYQQLGQMGLARELVCKQIETFEAERHQREQGVITTIIDGEKALGEMRIKAFERMSEEFYNIKNDLRKTMNTLFDTVSRARINYEQVAQRY